MHPAGVIHVMDCTGCDKILQYLCGCQSVRQLVRPEVYLYLHALPPCCASTPFIAQPHCANMRRRFTNNTSEAPVEIRSLARLMALPMQDGTSVQSPQLCPHIPQQGRHEYGCNVSSVLLNKSAQLACANVKTFVRMRLQATMPNKSAKRCQLLSGTRSRYDISSSRLP